MKITAIKLWNAHLALVSINSRSPAMPFKGKYRVARLFEKLQPEFKALNDQRTKKIESYENKTKEGGFEVPKDKLEEFGKWWEDLGTTEIEVEVEAIPYEQMVVEKADEGIMVSEILNLGPFLADEVSEAPKK